MTFEKQTHNSLGQPIHHTQEGIDNFHKWHGKSMVRDMDGRPKVVYHGTTSDFSEFKRVDGGNMWGHGHYFTDDAHDAHKYATGAEGGHNRMVPSGNASANIMPAYLNIKKPFYMDSHVELSSLKKIGKVIGQPDLHKNFDRSSKNRDVHQYLTHNADPIHGTAQQILAKAGHDGLVGKNSIAGNGTIYMAFHPHQVKSALGNSGKFSTKTPSLTESILSFKEFVETTK
jgi:hypothetical protein